MGELIEGIHGDGYYVFTFTMPYEGSEINLTFESTTVTGPRPGPIRHGIEFEQQFAHDLTNLQPPAINSVTVEVLDFIRGIYQITISVDDCTLDPRATPFFFWQSMYGTFEDVIDYRENYATFVFLANPGTGNQNISLIMGVGDGLGQVARRAVILKGNDAPEDNIAAFAEPLAQAPFFFDSIFTPFANIRFSDVPRGFWAYSFIYNLVEHDAISGFPDGTFRPDNLITVEEFLAMTINLSREGFPGGSDPDNWAHSFVQYARSRGLLPTDIDTTSDITRELAFFLLYRIMGSEDTQIWNRLRDAERLTSISMPFTDRSLIGDGYANAIERLFQFGIVGGFPEGDLRPMNNISRAEAAALLYNAVSPSGRFMFDYNEPIRPNLRDNLGELRLGLNERKTANLLGAQAFTFITSLTGDYFFTASNNFAPKLFSVVVEGNETRFIPKYHIPVRPENDPESLQVSHFFRGDQDVIVAVSGRRSEGFTVTIEVEERDLPEVVWPVPARNHTNSPFGFRIFSAGRGFHGGIDTDAPQGTYIYAVMDGYVERASEGYNGYGNTIIIVHDLPGLPGYGFRTLYAHLDIVERGGFQVVEGQRVYAGDRIGRMGNTGISSGDHLHFELLNSSGVQINPLSIYHPSSRRSICNCNPNNTTWCDDCIIDPYIFENPNPFFVPVGGEFTRSRDARFTATRGFTFNPDFCWDIAEEYYY